MASAAPRHQFRPPDEPNDEAGDDQCDQEDAREHDPDCRLVIRFCGCQHNVTFRCLTRREGCPSLAPKQSPGGGRVRAPDRSYQQRPEAFTVSPMAAYYAPVHGELLMSNWCFGAGPISSLYSQAPSRSAKRSESQSLHPQAAPHRPRCNAGRSGSCANSACGSKPARSMPSCPRRKE
jgi:hypothetical protein